MHGYDIARSVERTTGGCCSPTEGTIYPVLREFETGGFVTVHEEVVQGRQRRVYQLTEAGRAAFRIALDAGWRRRRLCRIPAVPSPPPIGHARSAQEAMDAVPDWRSAPFLSANASIIDASWFRFARVEDPMTSCCSRPAAASTDATRDPAAETRLPVAIIGAGPIGLAAAAQLPRPRHRAAGLGSWC